MATRAQKPDRVYPGRQAQALGRRGQGLNVVGQQLRTIRLAQTPPLSLEELSALLEQQAALLLTAGTLSKIERAQRSVYDYEILAFCQVLNVSPATLLGFEESVEPDTASFS